MPPSVNVLITLLTLGLLPLGVHSHWDVLSPLIANVEGDCQTTVRVGAGPSDTDCRATAFSLQSALRPFPAYFITEFGTTCVAMACRSLTAGTFIIPDNYSSVVRPITRLYAPEIFTRTATCNSLVTCRGRGTAFRRNSTADLLRQQLYIDGAAAVADLVNVTAGQGGGTVQFATNIKEFTRFLRSASDTVCHCLCNAGYSGPRCEHANHVDAFPTVATVVTIRLSIPPNTSAGSPSFVSPIGLVSASTLSSTLDVSSVESVVHHGMVHTAVQNLTLELRKVLLDYVTQRPGNAATALATVDASNMLIIPVRATRVPTVLTSATFSMSPVTATSTSTTTTTVTSSATDTTSDTSSVINATTTNTSTVTTSTTSGTAPTTTAAVPGNTIVDMSFEIAFAIRTTNASAVAKFERYGDEVNEQVMDLLIARWQDAATTLTTSPVLPYFSTAIGLASNTSASANSFNAQSALTLGKPLLSDSWMDDALALDIRTATAYVFPPSNATATNASSEFISLATMSPFVAPLSQTDERLVVFSPARRLAERSLVDQLTSAPLRDEVLQRFAARLEQWRTSPATMRFFDLPDLGMNVLVGNTSVGLASSVTADSSISVAIVEGVAPKAPSAVPLAASTVRRACVAVQSTGLPGTIQPSLPDVATPANTSVFRCSIVLGSHYNALVDTLPILKNLTSNDAGLPAAIPTNAATVALTASNLRLSLVRITIFGVRTLNNEQIPLYVTLTTFPPSTASASATSVSVSTVCRAMSPYTQERQPASASVSCSDYIVCEMSVSVYNVTHIDVAVVAANILNSPRILKVRSITPTGIAGNIRGGLGCAVPNVMLQPDFPVTGRYVSALTLVANRDEYLSMLIEATTAVGMESEYRSMAASVGTTSFTTALLQNSIWALVGIGAFTLCVLVFAGMLLFTRFARRTFRRFTRFQCLVVAVFLLAWLLFNVLDATQGKVTSTHALVIDVYSTELCSDSHIAPTPTAMLVIPCGRTVCERVQPSSAAGLPSLFGRAVCDVPGNSTLELLETQKPALVNVWLSRYSSTGACATAAPPNLVFPRRAVFFNDPKVFIFPADTIARLDLTNGTTCTNAANLTPRTYVSGLLTVLPESAAGNLLVSLLAASFVSVAMQTEPLAVQRLQQFEFFFTARGANAVTRKQNVTHDGGLTRLIANMSTPRQVALIDTFQLPAAQGQLKDSWITRTATQSSATRALTAPHPDLRLSWIGSLLRVDRTSAQTMSTVDAISGTPAVRLVNTTASLQRRVAAYSPSTQTSMAVGFGGMLGSSASKPSTFHPAPGSILHYNFGRTFADVASDESRIGSRFGYSVAFHVRCLSTTVGFAIAAVSAPLEVATSRIPLLTTVQALLRRVSGLAAYDVFYDAVELPQMLHYAVFLDGQSNRVQLAFSSSSSFAIDNDVKAKQLASLSSGSSSSKPATGVAKSFAQGGVAANGSAVPHHHLIAVTFEMDALGFGRDLFDGQWHHLALVVRRSFGQNAVKLTFDGRESSPYPSSSELCYASQYSMLSPPVQLGRETRGATDVAGVSPFVNRPLQELWREGGMLVLGSFGRGVTGGIGTVAVNASSAPGTTVTTTTTEAIFSVEFFRDPIELSEIRSLAAIDTVYDFPLLYVVLGSLSISGAVFALVVGLFRVVRDHRKAIEERREERMRRLAGTASGSKPSPPIVHGRYFIPVALLLLFRFAQHLSLFFSVWTWPFVFVDSLGVVPAALSLDLDALANVTFFITFAVQFSVAVASMLLLNHYLRDEDAHVSKLLLRMSNSLSLRKAMSGRGGRNPAIDGGPSASATGAANAAAATFGTVFVDSDEPVGLFPLHSCALEYSVGGALKRRVRGTMCQNRLTERVTSALHALTLLAEFQHQEKIIQVQQQLLQGSLSAAIKAKAESGVVESNSVVRHRVLLWVEPINPVTRTLRQMRYFLHQYVLVRFSSLPRHMRDLLPAIVHSRLCRSTVDILVLAAQLGGFPKCDVHVVELFLEHRRDGGAPQLFRVDNPAEMAELFTNLWTFLSRHYILCTCLIPAMELALNRSRRSARTFSDEEFSRVLAAMDLDGSIPPAPDDDPATVTSSKSGSGGGMSSAAGYRKRNGILGDTAGSVAGSTTDVDNASSFGGSSLQSASSVAIFKQPPVVLDSHWENDFNADNTESIVAAHTTARLEGWRMHRAATDIADRISPEAMQHAHADLLSAKMRHALRTLLSHVDGKARAALDDIAGGQEGRSVFHRKRTAEEEERESLSLLVEVLNVFLRQVPRRVLDLDATNMDCLRLVKSLIIRSGKAPQSGADGNGAPTTSLTFAQLLLTLIHWLVQMRAAQMGVSGSAVTFPVYDEYADLAFLAPLLTPQQRQALTARAEADPLTYRGVCFRGARPVAPAEPCGLLRGTGRTLVLHRRLQCVRFELVASLSNVSDVIERLRDQPALCDAVGGDLHMRLRIASKGEPRSAGNRKELSRKYKVRFRPCDERGECPVSDPDEEEADELEGTRRRLGASANGRPPGGATDPQPPELIGSGEPQVTNVEGGRSAGHYDRSDDDTVAVSSDVTHCPYHNVSLLSLRIRLSREDKLQLRAAHSGSDDTSGGNNAAVDEDVAIPGAVHAVRRCCGQTAQTVRAALCVSLDCKQPCSVVASYECPVPGCCFALCRNCQQQSTLRLRGRFHDWIEQSGIHHAFGVLLFLLTAVLFLPVLKSSLRILFCHSTLRCTFLNCFSTSDGDHMVSFAAAGIVVVFFCGCTVWWTFERFFYWKRRVMEIGMIPAHRTESFWTVTHCHREHLSRVQLLLATAIQPSDWWAGAAASFAEISRGSHLATFVASFTFGGLFYPSVVMVADVALVLLLLIPPRDTLTPMVGAAVVEAAVLLLVVVIRPFESGLMMTMSLLVQCGLLALIGVSMIHRSAMTSALTTSIATVSVGAALLLAMAICAVYGIFIVPWRARRQLLAQRAAMDEARSQSESLEAKAGGAKSRGGGTGSRGGGSTTAKGADADETADDADMSIKLNSETDMSEAEGSNKTPLRNASSPSLSTNSQLRSNTTPRGKPTTAASRESAERGGAGTGGRRSSSGALAHRRNSGTGNPPTSARRVNFGRRDSVFPASKGRGGDLADIAEASATFGASSAWSREAVLCMARTLRIDLPSHLRVSLVPAVLREKRVLNRSIFTLRIPVSLAELQLEQLAQAEANVIRVVTEIRDAVLGDVGPSVAMAGGSPSPLRQSPFGASFTFGSATGGSKSAAPVDTVFRKISLQEFQHFVRDLNVANDATSAAGKGFAEALNHRVYSIKRMPAGTGGAPELLAASGAQLGLTIHAAMQRRNGLLNVAVTSKFADDVATMTNWLKALDAVEGDILRQPFAATFQHAAVQACYTIQRLLKQRLQPQVTNVPDASQQTQRSPSPRERDQHGAASPPPAAAAGDATSSPSSIAAPLTDSDSSSTVPPPPTALLLGEFKPPLVTFQIKELMLIELLRDVAAAASRRVYREGVFIASKASDYIIPDTSTDANGTTTRRPPPSGPAASMSLKPLSELLVRLSVDLQLPPETIGVVGRGGGFLPTSVPVASLTGPGFVSHLMIVAITKDGLAEMRRNEQLEDATLQRKGNAARRSSSSPLTVAVGGTTLDDAASNASNSLLIPPSTYLKYALIGRSAFGVAKRVMELDKEDDAVGDEALGGDEDTAAFGSTMMGSAENNNASTGAGGSTSASLSRSTVGGVSIRIGGRGKKRADLAASQGIGLALGYAPTRRSPRELLGRGGGGDDDDDATIVSASDYMDQLTTVDLLRGMPRIGPPIDVSIGEWREKANETSAVRYVNVALREEGRRQAEAADALTLRGLQGRVDPSTLLSRKQFEPTADDARVSFLASAPYSNAPKSSAPPGGAPY